MEETNVNKRKTSALKWKGCRDFDPRAREIMILAKCPRAAQNCHSSFSFFAGSDIRIAGAEVCPAPSSSVPKPPVIWSYGLLFYRYRSKRLFTVAVVSLQRLPLLFFCAILFGAWLVSRTGLLGTVLSVSFSITTPATSPLICCKTRRDTTICRFFLVHGVCLVAERRAKGCTESVSARAR